MSLFRQSVRPPAVLSDEAIERYLRAVRAGLDPDPLFRRRLRGSVLNEYVAVREGIRRPHRPAAVGLLGRAVLYASFSLLLGVGGTMAAAQAAVPGDGLYPIKRHVEELRLRALPAHLHDDLAADQLRARIAELEVLTERGEWELVAEQIQTIEVGFAAFVAALPADAGSPEQDARVVALAALAHELDAPGVRASVETILASGAGRGTGSAGGGAQPASTGGPASGGSSSGGTASGGSVPGVGPGQPAPSARPSAPARQDPGRPSEHPGRTPQPRPSDEVDDAAETPRPTPRGSKPSEPKPDPTPRGQGPGGADPGD